MTNETMIDLVVPSEWDRIHAVRSVIGHVVHAVAHVPMDLAQALAMVASELMENAVKYGKEGEAISFRMQQAGGEVWLAVTNKPDPVRSPPARLHTRVAWLASFPTALDAYRASIAKLDDDESLGGAGLGLARILFEGECKLRCELQQDGSVQMEARRAWDDSSSKPGPP